VGVVSGESAFDVDTIARVSSSATSQVQPLPKFPTADSLNCLRKASSPPNWLSIMSDREPPGRLATPGLMLSQKKVWFQACDALLYTGVSSFLCDSLMASSSAISS